MSLPEQQSGLLLYYRENCELCDSMRRALHRLDLKDPGWREVDIDRDPDLIRQFDTLVPVLYADGQELCHHFIDEQALLAWANS